MGSWHGAALFIAAGALMNVALAVTLDRLIVKKQAEAEKPATAA